MNLIDHCQRIKKCFSDIPCFSLILVLPLFFSYEIWAPFGAFDQESQMTIVLLEGKFEVNASHQHFKTFRKWAPEKIRYLYESNLKADINQNVGIREIVKNQGGNNSLIFTLRSGTTVTYDTLINVVNPGRKGWWPHFSSLIRQKSNTKQGPVRISGHLPAHVEASLGFLTTKAVQHIPYVNLTLKEGPANVKIGFFSKEGQLVKSLADQQLERGKHRFLWESNRGKGRHFLKISIDQETIIYELNIK